MAWSPDGKQLAFLQGDYSFREEIYLSLTNEISIADISSGEVKTLAHVNELSSSFPERRDFGRISQLVWSPDGSMLAALVYRLAGGAIVFVLDANTGRVRAYWQGPSARWISIAWSADSRYVGFWIVPTTSSRVGLVGTLDVATGHTVTLPGLDFDWSPDGQWLAVPQDPDGVFLIAPDLSTMRWLDTPSCFSVAWRPNR
jgi:WD40 repeat protein